MASWHAESGTDYIYSRISDMAAYIDGKIQSFIKRSFTRATRDFGKTVKKATQKADKF